MKLLQLIIADRNSSGEEGRTSHGESFISTLSKDQPFPLIFFFSVGAVLSSERSESLPRGAKQFTINALTKGPVLLYYVAGDLDAGGLHRHWQTDILSRVL